MVTVHGVVQGYAHNSNLTDVCIGVPKPTILKSAEDFLSKLYDPSKFCLLT